MRRLFRENGLSIVLLSAFVVFWIGQSVVGQPRVQPGAKGAR
jgi:hypothetical protein